MLQTQINWQLKRNYLKSNELQYSNCGLLYRKALALKLVPGKEVMTRRRGGRVCTCACVIKENGPRPIHRAKEEKEKAI